jgi:phenylacetate-CoA ligase
VRGDIESILGCPVYDSYGSGEMGGLGFECPQHSGVHLNSDFFVFEVVRDGEEVSPGEAGEIVITGLTNFVMPLIRYEQRDRVVKGEEGACGCGSCLPRLRSIQGRLDDGLVAPDGSMVSPGMVCEKLEAEFGMRDFQLVQKNVDRFIMRVLAGDATEANAARVRGFLSELVGAKFHLEIEEWKIDDLPVKYRPVSSEVKPI